jgi:ssDNA-binding Zn-finger/Zn-ribbon topoisomerase 1
MMMEETLCPQCGGPMKSRANAATGARFWGCANFPRCRGTRNTDGEANTPNAEARPNPDEDDSLLPSERQRQVDRRRRWRS